MIEAYPSRRRTRPTRPIVKKQPGRICDSCLAVKAKCTGGLPCDRCYKLCIRCTGRIVNCDGQVFMDKLLTMVDFHSIALQFVHTAQRIHAQGGGVSLPRLKGHMRLYKALAAVEKVDVTHGLLDALCKGFNISMTDLEGPDLTLDSKKRAKPDHRVQETQATYTKLIKESATFKRLDDGSCGIMVTMYTDGIFTHVTNEAASRECISGAEVCAKGNSLKVLPIYLMASVISPEDRPLWFEAVIHKSINESESHTPFSAFVKLANRQGEVDLYHLKYRAVVFPELRNIGYVVFLERMPPSHHITRKPGHRHRLLEAFRKPEPQGAHAAGGYEPEAPTWEPVRIPSIACIPLSLPRKLDVSLPSATAAISAPCSSSPPSIDCPPPPPPRWYTPAHASQTHAHTGAHAHAHAHAHAGVHETQTHQQSQHGTWKGHYAASHAQCPSPHTAAPSHRSYGACAQGQGQGQTAFVGQSSSDLDDQKYQYSYYLQAQQAQQQQQASQQQQKAHASMPPPPPPQAQAHALHKQQPHVPPMRAHDPYAYHQPHQQQQQQLHQLHAPAVPHDAAVTYVQQQAPQPPVQDAIAQVMFEGPDVELDLELWERLEAGDV